MGRVSARAALFFLVICAGMAGYFVTGCRLAQPVVTYRARYYLEVVNRSTDRVLVNISVGAHDFIQIPAGTRSWSGIFALASGERRTFKMSAVGSRDAPDDNRRVRSFSSIRFYDAESDVPYRRYGYGFAECDDGPDCSDAGDDTLYYTERRHGTKDFLFVESPDRPFYLERDKEDPDLARLVITFVPSADASSPSAGSRSR